MSDDFNLSRLPSEIQARIDAACEAFETAWQKAPPLPQVDEFLLNWQEPERTFLLNELRLIDAAYRAKWQSQLVDPKQRSEGNPKRSEGDIPEEREGDNSSSSADTTGRPNVTSQVNREIAGSWIGPYRLVEKLGEGGMGEVWLAEQEHPVRRQVALKVIKGGVGSREIIARFEAERQALALMDHPNVARIIDAGKTDADQPFFAMELVRGEPLNQYCDRKRLNIEQRLRLFNDVCAGVQHAHQKGIIHRDLKPGNILVTESDPNTPGIPKVIDFGLAKALETSERLTDNSLVTEVGRILGTLKYMSPEQTGLESLDIDIRTDVYALGVILYELLTGSTPLDEKTLKGQALLSVLATIREHEPVKPSSRLSHSGDSAVSITTARRTDTGSLHRILAGDLDWVVMKALEKDRTRRYDSVSGLAADIRRYLDSEPVIARPPSLNYRVRKFVRKNRVGVLAASLVTLALIGGIAGTSLAMFRAMAAETRAQEARQQETTQRELAEARRLEAEQERELAEERRRQAEQNLAYARKGNEILGSVFSGLDPKAEYATVAELRNSLRDNLELAVAQLDEGSIGEPLTVAEMQNTLGIALLGLAQTEPAIKLLDRAGKTRIEILGNGHADSLNSRSYLARAYMAAGRLEEVIPILEETYEQAKISLGLDDPDILTSMFSLAEAYDTLGQLDKALSMYEQTLERVKAIKGDDHPDTLSSMNNLASGLRATGQLERALSLFEETLELRTERLGPDHLDTITSMINLAGVYELTGQALKALPLLEKALEVSKEKRGPEHPRTMLVMNNLAMVYYSIGQFPNALSMLEDALKLRKKVLGPDHHETLFSMHNLAQLYYMTGDLEKALKLNEQTYELLRIKLGDQHSSTLYSRCNLAASYFQTGQIEKAVPIWEQSLELLKPMIGIDHPMVLMTISNLAAGYQRLNQLQKAVPLYEEVIQLTEKKLGPDHPETRAAIDKLIVAYREAKQFDKTVELMEQTVEWYQANLGRFHPATFAHMQVLAQDYLSFGKPENAAELLEQLLPMLSREIGRTHPDTLILIAYLGISYRDSGRIEDAIKLLEEVVAVEQHQLQFAWVRGELAKAYIKAKTVEPFLALTSEQVVAARALHPADSTDLADVLVATGNQYLELSLFTQAIDMLREGREIYHQKVPDEWRPFQADASLGYALLGQAQSVEIFDDRSQLLEEAERLLLSGYEGMQQRESDIPATAKYVPDTLDRLIRLYEMLDKPAEATKFRELRAAYSDSSSEPKSDQ